MFDWYEPAGEIACPACGASLREWQGKDGPCALYVWRIGVAAPIRQVVGDEMAARPETRDAERLPSSFVIYSYDCDEHQPIEAECRCIDGVWTEMSLVSPERSRRR